MVTLKIFFIYLLQFYYFIIFYGIKFMQNIIPTNNKLETDIINIYFENDSNMQIKNKLNKLFILYKNMHYIFDDNVSLQKFIDLLKKDESLINENIVIKLKNNKIIKKKINKLYCFNVIEKLIF